CSTVTGPLATSASPTTVWWPATTGTALGHFARAEVSASPPPPGDQPARPRTRLRRTRERSTPTSTPTSGRRAGRGTADGAPQLWAPRSTRWPIRHAASTHLRPEDRTTSPVVPETPS